MSPELARYVYESLARGADRARVAETLLAHGWSAPVVRKLLDRYAGVDELGVPVPAPRMAAHHLARDLFLYLLAFVSLVLASTALGKLLFELIRARLPDATGNDYSENGMLWGVAQLLVAFPAYTALSWRIGRDAKAHPEKRDAFVRKLMIYLILAITACVALGDLVAVLYGFLRGELTLRFGLETLVVLGISLLIFAYYLGETRRDDRLVRHATVPEGAPDAP